MVADHEGYTIAPGTGSALKGKGSTNKWAWLVPTMIGYHFAVRVGMIFSLPALEA